MNQNKFSLITSYTSLWAKTARLALIRGQPLKHERSHPAEHECYWPAVLMGQVPKKDWALPSGMWLPCSPVDVNRLSFEMSMNVYWTAHIKGLTSLHRHCSKNFKFNTFFLWSILQSPICLLKQTNAIITETVFSGFKYVSITLHVSTNTVNKTIYRGTVTKYCNS
jgi:hypothetical protein